ncbi:hypothetical protein RO3G_16096 [Rhizopus delemar RA 99-880]|uniref:Uncharacterized protein n=1 Tax=Rhizopus delemar (strain RA 99-880 / ATCC MYA-4621 / FGSC 9543 / NRRL 43880) TaxID=246409 RepID=I1CSF5_RHIO9|nr:hypothetical protein RO3G_16096 [Rhizopus delemar RA 99-880]|eukprot:EIE91385.1 hypothetical protein RO3G_16096 [Rhizopus delemar RA 99-880]
MFQRRKNTEEKSVTRINKTEWIEKKANRVIMNNIMRTNMYYLKVNYSISFKVQHDLFSSTMDDI